MSFTNETQGKIKQFAKEQSRHYVDAAEMTYMEKLRKKTGDTKRKINRKFAKFRNHSDRAVEARDDMILYMSDYMADLISGGLSEEEALARAKAELAAPEEHDVHADFHERSRQYYENMDPANMEAFGLLFGGFSTLGLVAGALAGYIAGGGRQEFLSGGWIDVLVGLAVGAMAGTGLAMVVNALFMKKNR